MGLLDGIRVVRSSDPTFRRAACDVSDFFVDVPYEGEIVRARLIDGRRKLHKGGDQYSRRCGIHQRADQPDARYPAALDAIRDALHALRGRGRRTGLSSDRRCAGNHFRPR